MNETNWNDPQLVARVSDEASVREAAEEGQALMALWPLTQSLHMDNDVKYAEELQVRLTRQFAMLLIGDPELATSVTLADADFVYEGAESIPGRPQAVVDALIRANEAYDAAADYSDDGDAAHIVDAAKRVGAHDDAARFFTQALDDGDAFVGQVAQDAQSEGDPVGRVAIVFSAVALAFYGALTAGRAAAEASDGNLTAGAIAAMLYVNELGERYGVPRLFLTADRLMELDAPTEPVPFVRALAAEASREWAKHRADVLWDPDKAKADSEEEDRKRNREELAKKFQ